MENKGYMMSELMSKTGLSRRAIRFYVEKKILPPPLGKGMAARYTDEHLIMLQMIKILQGAHLKLEGIKEALAGMSIEEMKSVLRDVEFTESGWNTQAVSAWLASSGNQEVTNKSNDFDGLSFSFENISSQKNNDTNQGILSRIRREVLPEKKVWERYQIADGVELHLRDDVDVSVRKRLLELLSKLNSY